MYLNYSFILKYLTLCFLLGSNFDDSPSPVKKSSALPPLPPTEKAVSIRKAMAMKEPPPKKPDSPKKSKLLVTQPPPLPKIPQGQVVLDKFGNFRLMTPPELKKNAEAGTMGLGKCLFLTFDIN